MAYSLISDTWNGLRIAMCAMVNEAGTAVANVSFAGEGAVSLEGNSTCDRAINTTGRSWDGTPLAGSFAGCSTGDYDSEGWSVDGLSYTATSGVSVFVAINDGVNAGSNPGTTGYRNLVQFDNNTSSANSGVGWNELRQPFFSRNNEKGTATTITLPTTGKASVGWVYNANDADTGYWFISGEADTAVTTLIEQGSVHTDNMPSFIRRLQSWDGFGHSTGDLLCIIIFEGKLTGANLRDLHNDWPGELLNMAPVGGYKPLLQRSTVGNKLYDGTIL